MRPCSIQLVFGCSLLLAAAQATACYTVVDRNDNVVYNAQTPPVDMSQPLHETVAQEFPGGHLVKSDSLDCPLVQQDVQLMDRTAGSSPLLTDRNTAAALNVPHVVLPSGAAMIQPELLPPPDAVSVDRRTPTTVMGAPR